MRFELAKPFACSLSLGVESCHKVAIGRSRQHRILYYTVLSYCTALACFCALRSVIESQRRMLLES